MLRRSGSVDGFMRRQGGHAPMNLAPNKFQQWLSGACRMQENLLAAGDSLRTLLGEFTQQSSPDP